MRSLISDNLKLGTSRHQCSIYDGDPVAQLPVFAEMVKAKLEEGYRCMYFNQLQMLTEFASALSRLGVDTNNEISSGRLVLSAESPATEDDFDIDAMLVNLESALDQAISDGFKGLFATGDMTWEFQSVKNFSKLMEYEYRLEKFFQRRPEFVGICQYHKDTLTPEACRQGLMNHQSIFISETVSRVNPHFIPSGWVVPESAFAEIDELIDDLCLIQRTLKT